MRGFPLLIVLALAAGAGAARADDNVYGYGHGLLYLGAGISNDRIDAVTHTGVDLGDIDKTSWKVFAGLRPLRVFAVEADYIDLGNHTRNVIGGTTSADAKAFERLRRAVPAAAGLVAWTSTARPGRPDGS